MKKFAVALVSALALSALTAGAANAAHCPPVASSGQNHAASGTELSPAPSVGSLRVGAGNPLTVYGDIKGVGYGESAIGVNTTTREVSYSGEVAGTGLLVAHGEIENAKVGPNGVEGTADGRIAGQSGSGHLAPGGQLTVQTAGLVNRPCGPLP